MFFFFLRHSVRLYLWMQSTYIWHTRHIYFHIQVPYKSHMSRHIWLRIYYICVTYNVHMRVIYFTYVATHMLHVCDMHFAYKRHIFWHIWLHINYIYLSCTIHIFCHIWLHISHIYVSCIIHIFWHIWNMPISYMSYVSHIFSHIYLHI